MVDVRPCAAENLHAVFAQSYSSLCRISVIHWMRRLIVDPENSGIATSQE